MGGIVKRSLAMALLVARASRVPKREPIAFGDPCPCVSRASRPRFEGRRPLTRKRKARMASPRQTIAKAFGLDDATRPRLLPGLEPGTEIGFVCTALFPPATAYRLPATAFWLCFAEGQQMRKSL